MPEISANPNVEPEKDSRFWFRVLEILPGASVWFVLLAPIILAPKAPTFVTIFVLVFDLYWLVKSLNYAYILVRGYRQFKQTIHQNWQAELDALPRGKDNDIPDWHSLYHTVILTTHKEKQAILEASISSILAADYPKDHLILVLAIEERDGENARDLASRLKAKYGAEFFHFMVTEHPSDIVGEVKAKGANATWAAKALLRQVTADRIPLDRVLVTTADADTRFFEQYFSRLSHLFLTTPDRDRCAYQPIAMYFNNIWDAPLFSRVLAFGDTFWLMVESMRQYRLITFSTHAVPLQTLHDMDYWCTSIVNEDSRQYYRGYFHFKGNFRVVPMFVPVYMDAVLADNLSKSLKNLYLQKQRWAYGTEHFPYIVLECFHHKEIPLLDRLALIYRAFEGNFTWATSSYFITVVGWLPFLLSHNFQTHLVALNFQIFTRDILVITWVGLFISVYLTVKLIPPAPSHKSILHSLMMIVQWIAVPISAILFSSIPAIDAQTRLMLGKYIGFRVTEKAGGGTP